MTLHEFKTKDCSILRTFISSLSAISSKKDLDSILYNRVCLALSKDFSLEKYILTKYVEIMRNSSTFLFRQSTYIKLEDVNGYLLSTILFLHFIKYAREKLRRQSMKASMKETMNTFPFQRF